MELLLLFAGIIVPVVINVTCFRTVTAYGGPHLTIFLERWIVRDATGLCWKRYEK